MTLCPPCHRAHTDPHFRFPNHLVHPETGKRMVFDVRCLAMCQECRAVWHRGIDNEVRMIGRV